MEEKKKQFILELTELTRKYGIAIGGCGCCGSPFIYDEDDVGEQCGYVLEDRDEIGWVKPSDEDRWEKYCHLIVRPLENNK